MELYKLPELQQNDLWSCVPIPNLRKYNQINIDYVAGLATILYTWAVFEILWKIVGIAVTDRKFGIKEIASLLQKSRNASQCVTTQIRVARKERAYYTKEASVH